MLFLDTHVVIWLYGGLLEKLSKMAAQAIDKHDLFISPFVMLELQYLYEIKKVKRTAKMVLARLEESIGLKVADVGLAQLIEVAVHEDWTREPFDRLIVAQARLAEAQLLSCDHHILKNYSKAFWQ